MAKVMEIAKASCHDQAKVMAMAQAKALVWLRPKPKLRPWSGRSQGFSQRHSFKASLVL